jgi:hypothetical protein
VTRPSANEIRTRRYLLGELSGQELDQFEEEYVCNSELFDLLSVAEDDLIDDYAGGRLSRSERARFERHFLSSEDRRDRVRHAEALRAFANREASLAALRRPGRVQASHWFTFSSWLRPSTSWMGFLPIAASLVLLVGASWSFYKLYLLHSQVASIQSQQAILRQRDQELQQELQQQGDRDQRLTGKIEELNRQLEDERQLRAQLDSELTRLREQSGPVMSLALGEGFLTGSGGFPETKTVTVPRRAGVVRFDLDVKRTGYQSFQAVLTSDKGVETYRTPILKPRLAATGERVSVSVPVSRLSSGLYTLKLSGNRGASYESVSEYRLDIVIK